MDIWDISVQGLQYWTVALKHTTFQSTPIPFRLPTLSVFQFKADIPHYPPFYVSDES